MVARTTAAPPTPWSKDLAEPTIDKSAYIHSFSNLIGDVKVEANVLIAPGTSIRADEGTPFYIGEASNIQDGVVIHGLEQGRVMGDNGKEYSVWIGKKTCIAHMALIHGPVYIGDQCFIGFRSTVFNARVGQGCIVMMHALIQDVEIPPGKYVPSGSVITTQQQADRLPNVTQSDRAFASHVVEMNEALSAGYNASITPARERLERSRQPSTETDYTNSVTNMRLSSDIIHQVRSLLQQGYIIGAEHANQRRFKTKSWLTCGSISSGREDQVLGQIEAWLQDYEGEYVRLLGVDPQAKRRVLEMVIQRPGDTPGMPSRTTASYHNNGHTKPVSNGHSHAGSDATGELSTLIRQGYKVTTEFASSRRFKTKSWLTGPAINSPRELKSILADHQGEYVRLVAVDPHAKRRISEVIVQRPGENGSASNSRSTSNISYSNGSSHRSSSNAGLEGDVVQQVRSILAQGLKIGTEHADKRRFRTKSWQSCSPIESTRESEVISALEACLAEHSGEYVRLLGIDPKAKRRVIQTIIQRPGENQAKSAKESSSVPHSAPSTGSSYSNPSSSSRTAVMTRLDNDTVQQVRSILAQGLKIGTEHADKRRFRTKSWQSCSPIESTRESEVISALEACMAEHSGEYVRLLGIDPQAKRRVVETIIQRP